MPPNSRRKSKRSFNPLAFVLVAGGVFLALFVVVLLMAKSGLDGWLRGEGFRDWLVKRSSALLRSEVTLADLEWESSDVYTSRFSAVGYGDAPFAELGLDGVRAKMGGVRDKAFRIPEVSVNRLQLAFSDQHKRKRTRGGGEIVPAGSDSAGGPVMPAWLSRFAPDRVEVGRIEISSVNLSVEKDDGRVFHLGGAHATVEPDLGTGFWAIDGKGGKIQLTDQPEIRLKELGLRWRGSDLFVDRCSLGIYKEGHVEGKGEIGFDEGGSFDVDLAISSIDVDELVTGEWRDRLSGVVHGPVRIHGKPESLAYEGTLYVREGIIESMPVLKRIAQYTRSERFNRLVLNEAKVDFKSADDRVELRNLALQSDGLVRIEGSVDIVGDQLVGELQVGVTPGTMRWIPGAERLVFVEDRNGFRWAPLKLTGTTTDPKEDLSARLVAAAGESLLGELPGGLLEGAQGLLTPGGAEGDKSKSEELIDQGKKMLDLLSPFLRGQ